MAEHGAKAVGWVDCGLDCDGKQVYANLLQMRHIEINRRTGDDGTVEWEVVTFYYAGVETAIELNGEHSQQFLIAAGLRKPTSEHLWTPDAERKILNFS